MERDGVGGGESSERKIWEKRTYNTFNIHVTDQQKLRTTYAYRTHAFPFMLLDIDPKFDLKILFVCVYIK